MLSALLRKLTRRAESPVEVAAARRFPATALALPPYNPDDLVQRKGLEIYDRMQTDSQVATTLATKKFAVLSRGWRVLPASDAPTDREAAEFCSFALDEMKGSVEDFLFGVLDALAKGYSVCELNFKIMESGRWAGQVALSSIKHKDPSTLDFLTDEFSNVTGLLRLPDGGGEPKKLPPEKFVIYTYMPAYEDPHGRSDLRSCYKHWWVKDIMLRFSAAYLERFGAPVVKGTYKRGATRAQQEDLLRILERIQQETAIVIPEDVTVELLEAAGRGEDGFLEAIAYHDRQIAKAILGETLTQEEGHRTGALALAKVHQDTMLLRLQKIKRDLEEAVVREQVFRPLVRLNFRDAAAPRFVLGSLEDQDLGQLSTVLERLMKTGAVRADEPWIRGWLGIPAAAAGSL